MQKCRTKIKIKKKKASTLRRIGLKRGLNHLMYSWQERERKCSFGKQNPDHIFYVIRGINHLSKYYDGVPLNLLAIYSYVLSHLLYASERGWLPIIDQTKDPVNNKEAYPIHGTSNPWEYFWCQPIPYTLDEIYQSRKVILSKRKWYEPGNLQYSVAAHQNKEIIQNLFNLSQSIPLNEYTKDYIAQWKEKLFTKRGRILGITLRRGGHCRRDVYHAPHHPIQPTPEELGEIVKQRIEEWGMDTVFLATEEELYIEFFSKIFKQKLIWLPRLRYHDWKIYEKDKNPLYQPNQRYQTTLDYLTEMELLAACNGLIGSITSGLRYAIIQNNMTYEHLEILDYGRFAEHE